MRIISYENIETEYICKINSRDPSNRKNELIKSVYRLNSQNELFYINDE